MDPLEHHCQDDLTELEEQDIGNSESVDEEEDDNLIQVDVDWKKTSPEENDSMIVDELAKSVDESMRAVDESMRAVDESMRAVDESMRSVDESMKSVDELANSVDDSMKSVDDSIKSVDDSMTSVDDSMMSVDDSMKSVDGPMMSMANLSEEEEEFNPKIEVESNESSMDLTDSDDEEGDPSDTVASNKSPVDSSEDEEEVDPTISMDLMKPMEESDPRISIIPQNLSFEAELSNLINNVQSNQISWDSDSPLGLAAPFEPRRSSRNVATNKTPSPPIRQLPLPAKMSSSKRKSTLKKNLILFQVSVQV